MRWPLVLRSTHDAALGRERVLRRRLFALRDNIEQGIWRVKMNLRLVENANAERVLTMALVRDLKDEAGTTPDPER